MENSIELLQGLLEYSKGHFAYEEELLECSDYPFMNKHKMEHKLFIQHINMFINEHEGGLLCVDALLNFLLEWKQHHIKVMDKQALAFLKNNGTDTLGDIDV